MSEEFILREIRESDFDKGYMDCVNELTKPVEVDRDTFIDRFNLIKNKEDYYIVVAEDSETGKVLGSGTLIIEYKFIRGCALKGHIEDIVVLKEKRGKGIGKKIVEHLIDFGMKKGCYKIALVCEDKNTKFYEKCDLKEKEREMVIYNDKV